MIIFISKNILRFYMVIIKISLFIFEKNSDKKNDKVLKHYFHFGIQKDHFFELALKQFFNETSKFP